MRDFDDHSDDALHLSALGRSDPPRTGHPAREQCGLAQREQLAFVDLARHNHAWAYTQVQAEQKRIARRRRWRWTGRSARALAALTLLGALITYTITVAITGG